MLVLSLAFLLALGSGPAITPGPMGVTKVTATSPLSSSGGLAPNIKLTACPNGQILVAQDGGWVCATVSGSGIAEPAADPAAVGLWTLRENPDAGVPYDTIYGPICYPNLGSGISTGCDGGACQMGLCEQPGTNGTTTVRGHSGPYGNAVGFAQRSYAYQEGWCTPPGAVAPNGSFALSVWVKRTSLFFVGGPENLFMVWDPTAKEVFAIGVTGTWFHEVQCVNGIYDTTFPQDGVLYSASQNQAPWSVGVWSHVALTWDAATKTMRVFLDGYKLHEYLYSVCDVQLTGLTMARICLAGNQGAGGTWGIWVSHPADYAYFEYDEFPGAPYGDAHWRTRYRSAYPGAGIAGQ